MELWKYNNRAYNGGMFEQLLHQITEVKLLSQPVLAK